MIPAMQSHMVHDAGGWWVIKKRREVADSRQGFGPYVGQTQVTRRRKGVAKVAVRVKRLAFRYKAYAVRYDIYSDREPSLLFPDVSLGFNTLEDAKAAGLRLTGYLKS